ncbi:MAG: PIG-L family deacetylase [Candidatus Marinimicrobia bacterium]|jgi:LmbE family N-acetylglucosaminyl deacetylase|nr:PIG-L family deacetylase [Candidatus Neomarinimicrobiota bacterium]MCK9484382.1 PIG-L family deacetylase [Candidatus Neomarinimicrobiota bacterium]MCK9559647.1 PIG-L family deacetylase [Candidatus Neomarinimicrobiota bacterium]MDD5061165.1 PIG-L family deacetylase [Candidatus Neomarinimicrobiota bacterium]
MTQPEKKMNILAIGPHPDDVEIGCGASLAKFSSKGHNVYIFVASDGAAGGELEVRRAEQEISARILGINEVYWGGYRDTEIMIDRHTIASVEKVIHQVKPDMILVNYHDDTHQDHRNMAAITNSATRYIRNVLFYETPTTQNFMPNVFVDIGTEFLAIKLQALRAHTSQVNRTNIANLSIIQVAESSAHFRGVQARVACAEAFHSLRLFINI